MNRRANQKPDLSSNANAWEYSAGIHERVLQLRDRGARGAYPPIILGTDDSLHEKTEEHLEEREWRSEVVENRHHKATLEYMARVNCSRDWIAATDARPETMGAHQCQTMVDPDGPEDGTPRGTARSGSFQGRRA